MHKLAHLLAELGMVIKFARSARFFWREPWPFRALGIHKTWTICRQDTENAFTIS